MVDDPAAPEDPAADPAKPAEPAKPDPPAPPAAPPAGDPPPEPLGDAGKAALDAERKARKEAEKRAKALEDQEAERARAELTENERLKAENEEAAEKVKAATAKARNANLLAALADEGLVGQKAKGAIRLLDGVEFDDEDEPTNLPEAIAAAKQEYGESQFAADETPKPPAPRLNGGAGNQPGPEPNLTAEELQMAAKVGMDPAAYEEMKEVRTLEDFEAAQRRLAAAQQ